MLDIHSIYIGRFSSIKKEFLFLSISRSIANSAYWAKQKLRIRSGLWPKWPRKSRFLAGSWLERSYLTFYFAFYFLKFPSPEAKWVAKGHMPPGHSPNFFCIQSDWPQFPRKVWPSKNSKLALLAFKLISAIHRFITEPQKCGPKNVLLKEGNFFCKFFTFSIFCHFATVFTNFMWIFFPQIPYL